MYFRSTYSAQELAIRTTGSDGQLKAYEHSELTFHLGGTHHVAVKVQNTENNDHLRCEASCSFEPKPKIRNALEALREGQVPDSEKSLEEAEQEIVQRARDGHIDKYSLPWDVLPNYLKDFSDRVRYELSSAARRTVDVLRWRGAIHGPHSPLSSSRHEWSFDKKEWYELPEGQYIIVLGVSSHTLQILDNTRADIEALLAKEASEPLGHQLYREAWEQRVENLRSALVIGVAALEVGLKEFIASLVPQAEWLVGNVPTPPLVKMLQEYLPLLPVRCRIEGKVLPPPEDILKTLTKGVNLRNKVAHAGGVNLKYDTVEEVLLAVRDVLWLLDYYGGIEWACEHVSDKTRATMNLDCPSSTRDRWERKTLTITPPSNPQGEPRSS